MNTLPRVTGLTRSARFGILGVIAVGALTVVIALTLGGGSDPTLAMALILGVVFAFVAILFALQRRDLDEAQQRADMDALAPTQPVNDPTMVDDNSLLAALAIEAIDHAAIAASREGIFAVSRDSIGHGTRLMGLIFLAVVPWQLFQFVWSIVVFVPIIVVYAGYLAMRAISPGGTVDQAYEAAAPLLDPLGLRIVERPKVEIEPRPTSPGMQKRITGEVAYAGNRHGRSVSVRIESASRVRTEVGGNYPRFEIEANGERLRAGDGSPAAVDAVVEQLRPSSWWKGVEIVGGADGITVERTRGGAQHWMRDLWLAERLADAAAG